MTSTESSRVAVFGAGYAGLVTGAGFAELGHSVVIRDVIPEKVERLRRGETPIHEPGLDALIGRNAERLRFTLDPAETADCEFFFVCVDTPPTYSGDADLSRVWTVIDDLPLLAAHAVLVMKSTVPVGTGDKVRASLDARGLHDVGYVANPEFLAEGTAVRDVLHPDRIVIGALDESDGDAVERLHAGLDAPVVRMDVASAEMVKLAANAYLGTRISFINEIANVCEATGADVEQVAYGMGLDRRIGTRYLRPGIGFGGSCLDGWETVLVRAGGRTWLSSLERLFAEAAPVGAPPTYAALPRGLEVLSWSPEQGETAFAPVAAVTRRWFEGTGADVRTKMGRRLRCTADHPFVTNGSVSEAANVKLADELTVGDWLPLAGSSSFDEATSDNRFEILDALAGADAAQGVIVRPPPDKLAALGARGLRPGIASIGHPRGVTARTHDIVRSGALRLHELEAVGLSLDGAMLGTAKNGTYIPPALVRSEALWRIIGLYIAEGHCTCDGGRKRLIWSFHPDDEMDLVDEVADFWRSHGVKTAVRRGSTAMNVSISSRLLADWWLNKLGLGANCYEQRVPDAVWTASTAEQKALLSAVWRGDGSWSYIAGGPSVVLEYGTASRELADGLLRLLGQLGFVARWKVGRTAKSSRDNHWIIVSGADQVERLLDLVRPQDRESITTSLARQAKRIAPTGFRRAEDGSLWVRVTDVVRRPFSGFVYSLEVPGNNTFVATGGLVVHNCFPKDISFLKLLAGNSGYHFQLLNAVIEVNELQKRRVVGKLQKHLGALRGKTIALLGLAFKAGTDDLREAPSIVLASRLLAEGADVRAWDPVADARDVLRGVTFCDGIAEAVSGADAAVVVTEWEELRSLATAETREAMRNPLIIDGRNLLDPAEVRAAGFAYEGIGRPTSPLEGLPETPERESELQR